MAFAQRNHDLWHLDADAATALAPPDGPFADPRFLAALERFDHRLATHRVGAVAHDGARAALTVARKGSEAESIPFGYGGILADRSLEESEVTALLRLTARHLDVRKVRSRYLPLPIRGRPAHAGGRVIASTSVVEFASSADDVESRLAKKARQSIRRASRAGVIIRAGTDPAAFLDVYSYASRRFQSVYPARLITFLAESGLGRVYDAVVGDRVVASAFALTGSAEWMYWLAAETECGRQVEAGYPVVAQLLADARDAGAHFVNLGASTGLPGVAKFKRRMAGVDLPVIEHTLKLSRLSIGPRDALGADRIGSLVLKAREGHHRRPSPNR
jgi:hypothetical protein